MARAADEDAQSREGVFCKSFQESVVPPGLGLAFQLPSAKALG